MSGDIYKHMIINLKSPVTRVGGKHFLSSWIVEKIPEHVCYVEPFCGAGHVLFSKPESKVEVLNDVDGHLIGFFQVIKDHKKRQKLIETLQYMPYSRQLWQEMRDRIRGQDVATDVLTVNTPIKKGRGKGQKYQTIVLRLKENPESSDRQIARDLGVDHKTVGAARKELITGGENSGENSGENTQTANVQRAADWYYLNRSCFGGDMQSGGFALPSVTGRNPAMTFRNAVDSLDTIAERLRNVTIECLDYADCIQRYDSKDTLFFCDPPYLDSDHYYKENFALEAHRDLASMLNMVKGKAMVTHYQNDLYNELYKDWQRYEFQSFKGSHKAEVNEEKPKTVEVLYTNFRPEFKNRRLFNVPL